MGGMLRGQEGVSVAVGGERGEEITCSHRNMSLFINSTLPQPHQVRGSAYLPTPSPSQCTRAPGGPVPPETQSWISRAGTGTLWHQKSCPWKGGAQSACAGWWPAWALRGCTKTCGAPQNLGGGSLLPPSHLPFQKDLHKLPKAAGVVIPDGFGVTEGLQEGCCLQDLDPRRCGNCSGGPE